MNPYIEAKKAEANKKAIARYEEYADVHSEKTFAALLRALQVYEDTIDTLLDEIQEAVVPEEKVHKEFECGTRYESWCEDQNCPRFSEKHFNNCRAEVIEAFQHLRTGVETE